jgi:hypothetical protein
MRPILDIQGAYCPMGCGRRLHLMPAGVIQCLAGNCPNPSAVQEILASPETEDIVVFHENRTFTILHPLRERLGDLWDCKIHDEILRLDGPPRTPGRYRARVSELGALELERIDEANA